MPTFQEIPPSPLPISARPRPEVIEIPRWASNAGEMLRPWLEDQPIRETVVPHGGGKER